MIKILYIYIYIYVIYIYIYIYINNHHHNNNNHIVIRIVLRGEFSGSRHAAIRGLAVVGICRGPLLGLSCKMFCIDKAR